MGTLERLIFFLVEEPTRDRLAGLSGDGGRLAEEDTTIAVDGLDLERNSNLYKLFKISECERNWVRIN